MIPEAKTDGNIWICLFSLRLIVKKEKPMAEIIADKFPFQSPPPKSLQIIIKTPVKAMTMDSNVSIDIPTIKIYYNPNSKQSECLTSEDADP